MQSDFSAIGIDVGGTKIAAGWVVFPRGIIRSRRIIPTHPSRGGNVVLEETVRLARELAGEAAAAGAPIEGIGLGLCELVDPQGRILSQNCVSWAGLPVPEYFAALAPCRVEADVRAAALAEAMFGAGRGLRLFLYVTVGTGIASCLVVDGSPFTGARGATGTMASAPLDLTCEHCGKVNRETLEQIASGPGLVERYNRLSLGTARNGEDVVRLALDGDPAALSTVHTASESLGSFVALLVNVLDPECVIVGGGLGLSHGPFWDGLSTSVRGHIWSDVHRSLPIIQASTGPDAGLLGAAAAAWKCQRP